MKQLILNAGLFFICCISMKSLAQSISTCGQAEVMNAWFQKHPEKKAQFDNLRNQKSIQVNSTSKITTAPSYTIPVVFHILHMGGVENISDAQVIDQVAILNRDYQKQNADTIAIIPTFTNNIANVGFAFKLATIDPDGNCTNGIVRHYTNKTNWDANNLSDFIYSWPTNQYLNIYVVKTININATAYTFLPGIGIPDSCDAIVSMHNMVGSIGTSQLSYSRVLTHEVAHWFSIPHIWGVSNQPGVVCGDDGISDTPITKGFSTCNTTSSDVCTPGVFENAQNYMDYSPCKIMFTNGQAANMHASINGSTNGRNNLSTNANHILTGVVNSSFSCNTLADFYVTKSINCAGSTYTFTSLSQFGPSAGSLQWNFVGGSPSTSTNSVVVVSYPAAGVYPVSLTATSANGADTETKNSYITVVNGQGGLTVPYSFDFEGATLPNNIAIVNEQSDTVTWKQNISLGANSTNKSIYINNFPDSTNYGNRDYFETPFFDFTNTSALNLSYYYAYAKRYATQADSFKVQYSLDCGGSWSNVLGIPNINTMASNSGGTLNTSFAPSSSQWKLVSIPSGLLSNLNNKPSVKFRFFFKADYFVDGANNIYIDQINLTGSTVTSLSDLEKSISLSVYPNPTNAVSVIEFTPQTNSTIYIVVFDVTGRVVEKKEVTVTSGITSKIEINASAQLNSGIYFVTINFGLQKITKKIIIE